MRGNVGSTIAISEQSARAVSAVSACVNLIGGSIASMPLHTYRRAQDGDREAYKGCAVVAAERAADVRLVGRDHVGSTWSATVVPRRRLRASTARRASARPGWFQPIHPDRIEEVRKVDGRLHHVIAPDPAG